MCASGLRISTPAGRSMSLAVISPGPGHDQRRLDLGRVGVHPADDALQVEDDVGDVLLDAADRRELVRHALDPHARHRRAGERGEQHAPQRVAEGVAEATIERLDRERATVVVDGLAGDSGDLEVEHQGPNVVGSCAAWAAVSAAHSPSGLARLESLRYFEYSSTMSCSCTGAAISRRSGLRSTLAVSASWSAWSHAGTWPVSSVASRITCVAVER